MRSTPCVIILLSLYAYGAQPNVVGKSTFHEDEEKTLNSNTSVLKMEQCSPYSMFTSKQQTC